MPTRGHVIYTNPVDRPSSKQACDKHEPIRTMPSKCCHNQLVLKLLNLQEVDNQLL